MLMLYPLLAAGLVWLYVRQAEAETARHIEDTARRAIAPMLAEIERQRAEYLRRHSEINRR